MPPLEVGQHSVLERFDTVLRQPDVVPVVRHRLLDGRHRNVALRATFLILLTAEAVEVRVGRAEAVRRRADAEPPAAPSAEQVALEVMRSGLGFVFVEVTGMKNRPHGVESGLVNERLVLTGILDAAVGACHLAEPDCYVFQHYSLLNTCRQSKPLVCNRRAAEYP